MYSKMKISLLYLIVCYHVVTSNAFDGSVLNTESGQGYRYSDMMKNVKEKLKERTIGLAKDNAAYKSTSEEGKTGFHEKLNPAVSNVDIEDSDSPLSKSLSTQVGKHVVKVSSVLLSNEIELKPEPIQDRISVNPKFGHVIEIFQSNDEDLQKLDMQSADEKSSKESVDSLELPTDAQSFETVQSSLRTSNSFEEGEGNDENGTTRRSEKEEELGFIDSFEGSGEETSFSDDPKAGRLLGILSGRNETAPKCVTPKGEAGHCLRFHHCLLSNALNNFNIFLQYLCLIRGVVVGMCCPDNPVIEITHPDEDKNETDAEVEIKQPTEGCGLDTKTRIVGGTVSVPHEWTWMVALMRRNRFYCGGVIINNWYVLTAAHCVMGIEVKDLSVRLGEYDFTQRSKHQEDVPVAEIKRHSQFVTLTFQHDIALLKLRNSIHYTKFVGSICLPTESARDYSDVSGTVVGWGTVSFGGAASPVLRQVTVPVWRNEDCDQTYKLESINDAFLCAGSPEKGEDACQGDSGGPLMTLNDRGRWEVIGIVSWGRRCGDPTYPGVYTRVTTYLDWIAQNAV